MVANSNAQKDEDGSSSYHHIDAKDHFTANSSAHATAAGGRRRYYSPHLFTTFTLPSSVPSPTFTPEDYTSVIDIKRVDTPIGSSWQGLKESFSIGSSLRLTDFSISLSEFTLKRNNRNLVATWTTDMNRLNGMRLVDSVDVRFITWKLFHQGWQATLWLSPRCEQRWKTIYGKCKFGSWIKGVYLFLVSFQKLPIDEKPYYTFGRNLQQTDFCIDHQSCSRVHAALVYHKHLNRFFLTDLGSSKWYNVSLVEILKSKSIYQLMVHTLATSVWREISRHRCK